MEINDKSINISKQIIQIFNDKRCTVAEALDIMNFVKNKICTTTTVNANIDGNTSSEQIEIEIELVASDSADERVSKIAEELKKRLI